MIPVSLPLSFHDEVYDKAHSMVYGVPGVGQEGLEARRLAFGANNIYPAIPVCSCARAKLRVWCAYMGARSSAQEMAQIFEDPSVVAALTAVLGEGYAMHGHRALHTSRDHDQSWHKDSYWGVRRLRHHRPRWAMAMYCWRTLV